MRPQWSMILLSRARERSLVGEDCCPSPWFTKVHSQPCRQDTVAGTLNRPRENNLVVRSGYALLGHTARPVAELVTKKKRRCVKLYFL